MVYPISLLDQKEPCPGGSLPWMENDPFISKLREEWKKDMNNLKLTKGTAVVIAGPQGCGKTMLARKLASKAGTYIEASAHQIGSESELSELLKGKPNTVIVDELPSGKEAMALLKSLITSSEIMVRRPYSAEAEKVPAPHFIFCTGNDAISQENLGRRFHVVKLPRGRAN